MNESCAECRFARESQSDGLKCHFNPPKPHVVAFPTQGVGGTSLGIQVVSALPNVAPDSFCASFIREMH